jgi:hypothetical protein
MDNIIYFREKPSLIKEIGWRVLVAPAEYLKNARGGTH